MSLVALVIAFSVLGERKVPGLETILITALGVSTGFLLHEMAHKFVALRFGYWAEYRANMMGLGLAIVMAFGGFLFAAPGAVMISKSNATSGVLYAGLLRPGGAKEPGEEGDAVDIPGRAHDEHRTCGIFLPALSFCCKQCEAGSDLWVRAAYFAFFINLTLAAFNMLPFGPLDGKKIFDGNRLVWALVGFPTILVGLPVYLGMI